MPAALRKTMIMLQDEDMRGHLAQGGEWVYLQALPVAVLVIGTDGGLQYMNQAAEALLQTAEKSARGKTLAEILPHDDVLRSLWRRVAEQAEEVTEVDHILKVTHADDMTTRVRLVPAPHNEVVIMIDPPEVAQRVAQGAMQKEVMRTAGLMAAMLAHEVKNPLSGIRGAAQLLHQDASEENRPLADLICREVDRIKGLVDQMEFLSDRIDLRHEPVNIHEVLHYARSVAWQGFAEGIACREHYDPSLPPVAGSRDVLVQVFLNLIKNAAEALKGMEQPCITISTTARAGYRRKTADRQSSAGMIAVTVEDNGPGIPSGVRATLFEPFVSTKAGKRGLGLTVVAKILADLQGAIDLEHSAPGCTRFRVTLPVLE